MKKIIKQFIKDFDNLNKRSKYMLDFKNNLIIYKSTALYKADLSMFNYDFMAEHNVRMLDMTKYIENDNIDMIEEDCFIKSDKLLLVQYRLLDNIINIDTRYVKLITEDCYCKGLSDNNPVYYYSKKTDDLEAIIMPVRLRR